MLDDLRSFEIICSFRVSMLWYKQYLHSETENIYKDSKWINVPSPRDAVDVGSGVGYSVGSCVNLLFRCSVVSGVVSGLQHVHNCSLRTVFGESVGDGVKSISSDCVQRSDAMLAEGRLVGTGVGSVDVMIQKGWEWLRRTGTACNDYRHQPESQVHHGWRGERSRKRKKVSISGILQKRFEIILDIQCFWIQKALPNEHDTNTYCARSHRIT